MALSEQQLKQYGDDGFLVVHDFFAASELAPVIAELEGLVDGIAKTLRDRGHITNLHADKDFKTRLAALNRDYPGAGVLATLRGTIGPALFDLWSSPKLLDVVEQLIGPDVDGHPNWVLRAKTPETRLLSVPWHQDSAYFSADAELTFIPTAWIPLVDVSNENGTLQFVRGAHKPPRVYHHHLERRTPGNEASWYLYIDDADFGDNEVVTCPAPLGSVVLHSNFIPHRSTENHSDTVRWATDVRWVRPGLPTGLNFPSVPMRRAGQPGLHANLDSWAQEFEQKWHERHSRSNSEEIDFTVNGPWIDRWADEPPMAPRRLDETVVRRTVDFAYA